MGDFGKGAAYRARHVNRDRAQCDSRAIQSFRHVGGPAADQSLTVLPVLTAS